jgi:hypothetical protein
MTLRERLDREQREFEERRRWYEEWVVQQAARIIEAAREELEAEAPDDKEPKP